MTHDQMQENWDTEFELFGGVYPDDRVQKREIRKKINRAEIYKRYLTLSIWHLSKTETPLFPYQNAKRRAIKIIHKYKKQLIALDKQLNS